jgi:glycosyltransferase involved in cell wall biosynthesis
MPFSDLSNGNSSVGNTASASLTTDSPVIFVPRHYSLSAGLFWLKDIALELDSILPNINWRIVVAGSLKSDGLDAEHLVHLLTGRDNPRYRHISNRLLFLGELNRSELREQLSAAFVVCIPTFAYEGACLAAVEALSIGKPVVATNVGGLNDTIVPGFNGLLSRPCPIEIAQTLARLLTDIGLYNRIVANLQLTSGQFDLSQWYAELDHVFRVFHDDL